MYCTRRKVIFPFVLFIERKIPLKATFPPPLPPPSRAANAIYRGTQLVRLGRTQPTLNTNNDIARVASDSARYFKHNLLPRYDITTHDDFLTFFFFFYMSANTPGKCTFITRLWSYATSTADRGDFHRTFIVMKSKSWDTFINLDEN